MKIALIGPDGAGKSALIDALLPAIAGLEPDVEVHGFHLKTGTPRQKMARPPTPAAVRQYPPFLSVLKLTYLALESHVKYWIFRLNHRRGRFHIVYDRHVIEILADQRRFGYNGPRNLLDCFYRVACRPDRTVVVLASAEAMVARKGELSLCEARQAIEDYLRMADEKGFAVVWNDGLLQKAVDDLLEHLFG